MRPNQSNGITITVQYQNEDFIGLGKEVLRLYNYDWARSSWKEAVPCGGYLRDGENSLLTAYVCHFSEHALLDWTFRSFLSSVLR